MSTFEQRMKRIGVDPEGPPPVPATEPTTTPMPAPEPQAPAPPAPPAPTPTPPSPPAPVDRISIINEVFGTDFKTEEDVAGFKNVLTTAPASIKEWETKYSGLEAEYNDLVGGLDPSTLFANPQIEALNGMLKKFPGKNPLVMAEIAGRDFADTHLKSPLEILATDRLLENPGIYQSKAEAMEDVMRDYNIDDAENIDASTMRRMQVAAKSTVDKFNDLKGQVEKSKFIDLKKTREEKLKTEAERIKNITEATESLFTKDIPAALKDVEFAETYKGDNGQDVTEVAFKYQIGENFAKSKVVRDLLDGIRQNVIREGGEWNADRADKIKKDAVSLLEAVYMHGNRQHVYSAIKDDLTKKFEDAEWVKRHNVKPIRQDGRALPQSKDERQLAEAQAEILKARGIKLNK